MVVRLQKGQFTAGDMIIAVRSRRNARADPRFYGANVSEIKRVIQGDLTKSMNPSSRVVSQEDFEKNLKYKGPQGETTEEKYIRDVNNSIEDILKEQYKESIQNAALNILKERMNKSSDSYFDREPFEKQLREITRQSEQPVNEFSTKVEEPSLESMIKAPKTKLVRTKPFEEPLREITSQSEQPSKDVNDFSKKVEEPSLESMIKAPKTKVVRTKPIKYGSSLPLRIITGVSAISSNYLPNLPTIQQNIEYATRSKKDFTQLLASTIYSGKSVSKLKESERPTEP